MGKRFWNFKAKENDTAELLIYGDISDTSWWGDEVTPKDFKKELDDLGNVSEIKVFINSGGGDVFAGQAIYSMLKRHSAQISVYIDGLAASIASVIAMAGDKIYIPKNAMLMVHNPWTYAVGNSDDFRKLADDMDKIRESIIATYEDKTGLEQEKIIELMDAETWLTAEEAIKYGFADQIEESKQIAASLDGGILMLNGQKTDVSKFKNMPKLAFASLGKNEVKTNEVKVVIDNVDSFIAKLEAQVVKAFSEMTGISKNEDKDLEATQNKVELLRKKIKILEKI